MDEDMWGLSAEGEWTCWPPLEWGGERLGLYPIATGIDCCLECGGCCCCCCCCCLCCCRWCCCCCCPVC